MCDENASDANWGSRECVYIYIYRDGVHVRGSPKIYPLSMKIPSHNDARHRTSTSGGSACAGTTLNSTAKPHGKLSAWGLPEIRVFWLGFL